MSVVIVRTGAKDTHSLLQKPITVSVYRVQAFWLCDGDMVVSHTDYRPVFLMSPMHPSELLASSRTKC